MDCGIGDVCADLAEFPFKRHPDYRRLIEKRGHKSPARHHRRSRPKTIGRGQQQIDRYGDFGGHDGNLQNLLDRALACAVPCLGDY